VPRNPFLYPQVKHRRRLQPPHYSAYGRYKPYLKEEFFSQCVYCRLPDGVKGPDSFEVDHYRPRSQFPELASSYANLFYACNVCNRRKGPFWPSEQLRKAGQFIPNPCDHNMFQHLRYRGVQVEAKSAAGEVTIKLLGLNDAERVDFRDHVSGIIHYLERVERQLQGTLEKIDQKIAAAPIVPAEVAQEKETIQNELARVQRYLTGLAGHS
jgi:hypothetical protein